MDWRAIFLDMPPCRRSWVPALNRALRKPAFLRARYYDSATGRFISKDPTGTGYRYGRSNPASLSDPSGLYELCGEDETWGYICYDSTQVGLPADPPSS
jgi:hypothetical protein